MRTRLAFITTATLTRGQSTSHQLILTTGEMCRTSPDALWPHLNVLFSSTGKRSPATTWSTRQRWSHSAINQEVVNYQHKLARDTWLCTWDWHMVNATTLETRSLPHDHWLDSPHRFFLRVFLQRLPSCEISEGTAVLRGGSGLFWPKPGARIRELLGHFTWRQSIHTQLGHHCWWVEYIYQVLTWGIFPKMRFYWNCLLAARTRMTAILPSSLSQAMPEL